MKLVLFDLDGTLLPMDQDIFIKAYFKGITEKTAPYGFDPKALIATIWAGTEAMVKNDGSMTNEAVFWKFFAKTYGDEALKNIPVFDSYYETDFQKVRAVCGHQPKAKELIQHLKDRGVGVVLATNPIFPRVATESRVRWAGLEPDDFAYITTYENARYSKPNLDYYREILEKVNVSPEDCLMVGNDVDDDMVVTELGMKVFLLTDCLINRSNKDISIYPNGDFDALTDYIKAL